MTDQFITPERFRQQLLDALLAHAATLPAADSVPAARRRTARRRAGGRVILRRLVPALALATILAAVVLVLRSGGVLRPQPATAAGVLNASATALGRDGGSRALTPGEYFYSRLAVWWRYAGLSRDPYVVRSVQESWVARDGRGRTHYQVVDLSGTDVNQSLPFTRSEETQQRHAQARPFILSSVPVPGILLSYAQLRRLPTDPSRLAAATGPSRSATSAPRSASKCCAGSPRRQRPRRYVRRSTECSQPRLGSVYSAEPATASAATASPSPSTSRTPDSS
jgi:hypothetical protein